MPRNIFQIMLACLLLVGLPSLTGCGDSGAGDAIVQGTVTVDGQLAESGSVVFHSQGDSPAAYGTIREDGTYVLRVGRGNVDNVNASKIMSGDYVATVQIRGPSIPDAEFEGAPPRPGPLLIAEKFTSKATSGLAHTIKAGRNVVNLELESPSEEELQARAEAAAAKEAEEAARKAAEENTDSTPAEEATETEAETTDTEEEVSEGAPADAGDEQNTEEESNS